MKVEGDSLKRAPANESCWKCGNETFWLVASVVWLFILDALLDTTLVFIRALD